MAAWLAMACAVAQAQSPSPAASRGVLVLRPSVELRELAGRVAPLLELRSGLRVSIGDAPPPGLPEAVPAGHLALLRDGVRVRLVLGGRRGSSLDAVVLLKASGGDASARAIALAAEALRDAAGEGGPEQDGHAPRDRAVEPADGIAALEASAAREPAEEGGGAERAVLGTHVEPLVYARVYGGASTASSAPMAGLGTGVGLCVLRQCLFLAGEIPATTGNVEQLDVRYRYVTFLSGFYSRPFSFGKLTPGASLGFLTRLGHFRADMGYRDTGLDSDLGARGSLELAFEVMPRLDVMSEVGVDLTLDRHRIRDGLGGVFRGERWSPWVQGAVRFRP